MRVLGIETSCDETAAAVYDGEAGLLAHELHSQVALHATYGGVVPELASRDHLRKLLPLLEKTVECSGGRAAIDGIAYTSGPGLVGALLVGAAVARSLAYRLAGALHRGAPHGRPPAGAAARAGAARASRSWRCWFPAGTRCWPGSKASAATSCWAARSTTPRAKPSTRPRSCWAWVTPGGPQLAQLAEQGRPDVFSFPRPLLDRPGLDFSFSGLKTAVVVALRNHGDLSPQARADAARGFEEAVVDTLVVKCQRALEATGAGHARRRRWRGRQRRLRARMLAMGERRGARVVYPRAEFCTDNAAMIALLGHLRLAAGERDDFSIRARARWPMTDLVPPAPAA